MRRHQWKNIRMITLNKGEYNTEYVNAQNKMNWERLSLFRSGWCPGADGLPLKAIKRGGYRLVNVLYTITKDTWENLEGRPPSPHLQERRQMSTGFFLFQEMCSLPYCIRLSALRHNVVSGTPRNHGHNLPAMNTAEMHWIQHAPLHDICRHYKISR